MNVLKYCLFLCIISVAVVSKRQYSLKHPRAMFEEFVKKYNKSYKTEAEYERRFEIFKSNVRNINKRNLLSDTAEFGINKFTDWTDTEKSKRMPGLKEVRKRKRCSAKKKADMPQDIPDEWDWRKHNLVTSVRSQGDCGSCWAISTVGAVEGQYARHHKNLVRLSDQQVLDCSGEENSCDGGLPDEAIDAAVKDKGITTDKAYPFRGFKHRCQANEKEKVAVVLKSIIYHNYKIDEDYLKLVVYHLGPIIIGMQAGFGFFDYQKGIAMSKDFDCYPALELSHAVLFVGYGTENGIDYWLAKNSYSPEWGERGFFRMQRNVNTCNLTSYVVGVEVEGGQVGTTNSDNSLRTSAQSLMKPNWPKFRSDSRDSVISRESDISVYSSALE